MNYVYMPFNKFRCVGRRQVIKKTLGDINKVVLVFIKQNRNVYSVRGGLKQGERV